MGCCLSGWCGTETLSCLKKLKMNRLINLLSYVTSDFRANARILSILVLQSMSCWRVWGHVYHLHLCQTVQWGLNLDFTKQKLNCLRKAHFWSPTYSHISYFLYMPATEQLIHAPGGGSPHKTNKRHTGVVFSSLIILFIPAWKRNVLKRCNFLSCMWKKQ